LIAYKYLFSNFLRPPFSTISLRRFSSSSAYFLVVITSHPKSMPRYYNRNPDMNAMQNESYYPNLSVRGQIQSQSACYRSSETPEYYQGSHPSTSSATCHSATGQYFATPPQPMSSTQPTSYSPSSKPRIHLATNISSHHPYDSGCRSNNSSASPCTPPISQPLTPVATEPLWVNETGPHWTLADAQETQPYHQFPACETIRSPALSSGSSLSCMAPAAHAAMNWSYDCYGSRDDGGSYEPGNSFKFYEDSNSAPFSFSNHYHPVPSTSTYTNSLSFALSLPTSSNRQGSEPSRKQSSPWTVHQPRPVRPIPIVSLSDLSKSVGSNSFCQSNPNAELQRWHRDDVVPTHVHSGIPNIQNAVEEESFCPQGDMLLFQPISSQVLAQFVGRTDDDTDSPNSQRRHAS
jgi:hypothetical protein